MRLVFKDKTKDLYGVVSIDKDDVVCFEGGDCPMMYTKREGVDTGHYRHREYEILLPGSDEPLHWALYHWFNNPTSHNFKGLGEVLAGESHQDIDWDMLPFLDEEEDEDSEC